MKKKIDETKVILVTKEMKKEYPELKNISMIQLKITKNATWNKAMKYAKNLKLFGYRNWRLPNIIECRKIVELFKDEMKLDYCWYWTNVENSTSRAYLVSLSGYVSYHVDKSDSRYCFCVR